MRTQQCMSCGTHDAMQHFEGRTFRINTRGMIRDIPDIAGWECEVCHEVEFDHDDDSAERYCKASDLLLIDARKIIAAEMKRIRRKLHLTQKDAVRLLTVRGHNAFSRYERAEIFPPEPLLTLMRLLDKHPHLLAEIEALNVGEDLNRLLIAKDALSPAAQAS
ncbi:type II toxin-antitoxin system MqsA family antitoxin [Pseudomonas sp. WS 5106]|uniref:Type II toxin-antitoxin system MqsA family antitoxin n=1 Tax=Pseudomonas cremoris TaxID=2724178 RepID=A0A7X1AJU0_9PSED|nr:type II toxin-antitoxin system MqsA family antitoxin [Pseudomonas cremoris]MBC2381897.1 type II toxin-antitoxin system MqsA family antitoxin [Pseudomonas cremoris]MBC2405692.1 type II toxin-antitoxin system MqsA family antitoxin [Pseudomonas cremoris]MBC2406328.1 type II toxin-antitoxin system MqsA family antitoxin [Pseudomonas cremoris]